jgi:hypothetical protein
MILQIVKCEECENQFPILPHQRPYEWDIPAGWLTLIEGNPQTSEGWHFCGSACLSGWIANRKARGKHERATTPTTAH